MAGALIDKDGAMATHERQRLGIQDALWLEMDRPNNLMVVDSVVWTAEPLDFDRARIDANEVPEFRNWRFPIENLLFDAKKPIPGSASWRAKPIGRPIGLVSICNRESQSTRSHHGSFRPRGFNPVRTKPFSASRAQAPRRLRGPSSVPLVGQGRW